MQHGTEQNGKTQTFHDCTLPFPSPAPMRHFDPIMASEDNALRAAALREEGNGFYKIGKMAQGQTQKRTVETLLLTDNVQPPKHTAKRPS
jgi:hypothetical protein